MMKEEEVTTDRHVMVAFAPEEATDRLGDHCGFVWCHSDSHRSLCTLNEKHSQARHLLIGGLALKPPLHGHQQAVTIVEKAPIGSEVAEAAVESAMVEIHCWLTYKNVLRFVQRFRTE